MNDREGFDEVFRDIAAFAEDAIGDIPIDESAFGDLDQLEGAPGRSVDDELILGEDYVTYILYSVGSELENLSLSISGNDIELTDGEFSLTRELGVRVEGEDATADVRNGVLSVRLRRILERDDGV